MEMVFIYSKKRKIAASLVEALQRNKRPVKIQTHEEIVDSFYENYCQYIDKEDEDLWKVNVGFNVGGEFMYKTASVQPLPEYYGVKNTLVIDRKYIKDHTKEEYMRIHPLFFVNIFYKKVINQDITYVITDPPQHPKEFEKLLDRGCVLFTENVTEYAHKNLIQHHNLTERIITNYLIKKEIWKK